MAASNDCTIYELLGQIQRRPGAFIGHNDGRIDYLFSFLSGFFMMSDMHINDRYWVGLPHMIHKWIEDNKKEDSPEVKFFFCVV